jgi:hypothetical protein
MSGETPPLPNTPSWRGAQLKHRDNFTFYLYHAMKAYWGVEVCSTHTLTSALEGCEWSASLTGRFTPRERAPGTHWIGDWVGPGAVLEAVVKRKIPSPRRESNPRTILQLVWYS